MLKTLRLRLRAAWAAFVRDPKDDWNAILDSAVRHAIANDLARNGPVTRAFQSRYGLSPQGRVRQ